MPTPSRKVITRPHATPAPVAVGWPFLSIGFRPFFLCAALFAPTALTVFLFALSGGVEWSSRFSPVDWHRHEMLFGYTLAIVAGFLFTAVQNWTSRPTPKGALLATMVALWGLGRLAVALSSQLPLIGVLFIDLCFPVAIAYGIGRPLLEAGNTRNLFFLGLLALLSTANALTYFGRADIGYGLALNIFLLMIIIIGGRVIAMFTERPLGLILRRDSRLDRIIILTSLTAFLLEMVLLTAPDGLPRPVAGFVFLVAGTANLWRLSSWQSHKALKHPLIWVLHAGYAWLVAGMALKAAYFFGAAVPNSIATHALTAGAIGVTTLGFISRVALGHTGRPLVVGWDMATAFVLINTATLTRVCVVWLWPDLAEGAYRLAAVMWFAAFALFLIRYTPYLLSRRADDTRS